MINYRFRYSSQFGGVVRTTIMQCATDDEAVQRARDTMKDHYARLEIFEGERPVFAQLSASTLTAGRRD